MYYGYSRINVDSRLYRFTRTLSHVVKINCWSSGILVRQFLLHDRVVDLSADYSLYRRRDNRYPFICHFVAFGKKSHFGSSCDFDDSRDSRYSIDKSYCYIEYLSESTTTQLSTVHAL